MQLAVLGLNHKTAPVHIRERFSISEEKAKTSLHYIHEYAEISEWVILSTCNRTEMYVVVDDAQAALPCLKQIFARMAQDAQKIDEYLFYFVDKAAIKHLFRVSCSLDSLVIGEGQILSQVKKAYALARDAGTTGTVLNTLFNRAIAVGKKVRTKTRIAYNAVSVSYAAVELAKNLLGDLRSSKVLILGAGTMSELTARHLVDNQVASVFVSNRKYGRAVKLAQKFGGVAVPFENFIECAVDADIIITSTGAPHYIIRSWDVAHIMPKRQGRPIIFIDIAVPRDVEPEVAALAGVKLYNMDDLEAVVEKNVHTRELEALAAQKIIDQDLAELVEKFKYLKFRPLMACLRDKAERIRQRELKRALVKLPGITPKQKRIVENMSKMLMRKLLRDPMISIHQAANTEKEKQYFEAVHSLFKLDEPEEEKQKCGRIN